MNGVWVHNSSNELGDLPLNLGFLPKAMNFCPYFLFFYKKYLLLK